MLHFFHQQDGLSYTESCDAQVGAAYKEPEHKQGGTQGAWVPLSAGAMSIVSTAAIFRLLLLAALHGLRGCHISNKSHSGFR